ncbi:MAG: NADH-quinone oxidoreductase subunit NuoF [Deltaproteobacteria bacterium]|nr:NADH-quinone oxidoreductase subunit NuoF [Deltaproteobacteria bacterium]MCX7952964.1 NADH-quinone oxidoreductase subunit NuoF [Deltaproteobacteria bacterium]
MIKETRLLLKNITYDDQKCLEKYIERGGFRGFRKVLELSPDQVIEHVKVSGLRGRGGAGFPTGLKWSFVPKNSGKPVYVVCNADESEPGTFKDRILMERDPFLLIEGILIACYALGSKLAFIYIRGEYQYAYKVLLDAIKEANQSGYLGDNILGSGVSVNITIHRGAGAYICGEETALLNSLEGKKGYPRIKPPFPAVKGLYGCPTVINNVETLCALPVIFDMGAEEYAKLGTEKSKGTKLFSVSGIVCKPGVYEVELGVDLIGFINDVCGGIIENVTPKIVIPGGSSVPALTWSECEGVKLDYESLQNAGTMLGSGGFMVFGDNVSALDLCLNFAKFYAHESCGQCTPCREGAKWLVDILQKLKNKTAYPGDLERIQAICSGIAGHTICPFGDALVTPVISLLKKFPDDFSIDYGVTSVSP